MYGVEVSKQSAIYSADTMCVIAQCVQKKDKDWKLQYSY